MANEKIRDLMTTPPIVLDETATAAEAAQQMKQMNVGDVLVRAADGGLRGIVTDRDLALRCLADEEAEGAKTPLGECCTRELATLEINGTLDDAVKLMGERAVRRLPVVDGAQVVGIVSLGDLACERDPRSALGRISAARASAA